MPRIVPVNEEPIAPERVVANGSEGHHMGAVSMSVVRRTDGIDPSRNRPDIVRGLRRRIILAGSGSGIAGGQGSSVSGEPSSALAIRPMHAKHYTASPVPRVNSRQSIGGFCKNVRIWAFFAFLRTFLEKSMNFCTTVGVNPWIVFHIATCGGTRLHDENSLPFRFYKKGCQEKKLSFELEAA